MKIIAEFKGKKVVQTQYPPLFAYKSLVKLLEELGFECYSHGKSRNTNSYYINFANEQTNDGGEIRISDHSKFVYDTDEKEMFEISTLNNGGIDFEINIITKEGFEKAKNMITSLIKN